MRETSPAGRERIPREGTRPLAIVSDRDLIAARQAGRTLAQEVGFASTDLTLIATAISELARNMLLYAGRGELALDVVRENGRRGIAVVARDRGPGITDVARAMEAGYSTSGGLGLGLPGVKRLMDDFEIQSRVGRGTIVTVRKWKR